MPFGQQEWSGGLHWGWKCSRLLGTKRSCGKLLGGRPRLLSFLLKIIRTCWLICFGPQLSDPSFLSPLPAQEEGMP